MSVLILRMELYRDVFVKAFKCNKTNSSEVGYIYNLNMSEYMLKLLLKTLAEMNYVSFATRYPSKTGVDWRNVEVVKSYIDSLNYELLSNDSCNIYQLFKHLQCIKYQIEVDTIQRAGLWKMEYDGPYEMLESIIAGIGECIVGSLPEYQAASWS